MGKIWCLGILVADFIARPVDKFPERGKLELVSNTRVFTGGCATNTSIALAKLGQEVEVLGKVGDDILGQYVIDELKKNRVGTEGIMVTGDRETSTTIVLVDREGERTFIHNTGANGELTLSDIDFALFSSASLVHIAGFFLLPGFDGGDCQEFLRRVKVMGITTTLDTAWDAEGRWLELLEGSLPYIDYFLPSYGEAVMLSGEEEPREIAAFFLERGVGTVGLKMGEKGCFIKNKEEEIFCPPYPVEVVDTTGAGDSWVAGFLTGLSKGWPLEKVGKFANAVGASCVRSMGASSGIRGFEETVNLMQKGE